MSSLNERLARMRKGETGSATLEERLEQMRQPKQNKTLTAPGKKSDGPKPFKPLYEAFQAVQGKEGFTGAGAIDSLAAGLTGSALMAAGVVLASLGLVSGGGTGDDDQDRFNDLLGKQDYALRLPDGTSVTLDWMAPEALPFFMGVEAANLGGENGISPKGILEAFGKLSNPLLEMSMLQSLNDILDKRGFEDSGMGAIVASALTSYVTQGLPTLAGQAERTGDEVRTTTHTDVNGLLPTTQDNCAASQAWTRAPPGGMRGWVAGVHGGGLLCGFGGSIRTDLDF